jgi:hypothetical protein
MRDRLGLKRAPRGAETPNTSCMAAHALCYTRG